MRYVLFEKGLHIQDNRVQKRYDEEEETTTYHIYSYFSSEAHQGIELVE